MVTLADYQGEKSAWCPACGNFGILAALKKALVDLGKLPHEILLVSGIGQAGKLPHYLRGNTFNGLHGRTLSPATGAKIANHELTVIAIAGDGDCYGEGGNHFIHTIRRNPDITLLVHDNQIYGLTKGQASPTSDPGMETKIQPQGVTLPALNPVALAIALDGSFVARGFSGETDHLAGIIKAAIQHRGFSLVDILQPCVTFNKKNTLAWYKERTYKLEETYNPTDRLSALKRAEEWGEKIPLGILYRREKPVFDDQWAALKKGALVKQPLDRRQELAKLLMEFQ